MHEGTGAANGALAEAAVQKPGRLLGRRLTGAAQAAAVQQLSKDQAGGVELLGPDGLLSQLTKAVLETGAG